MEDGGRNPGLDLDFETPEKDDCDFYLVNELRQNTGAVNFRNTITKKISPFNTILR
jgi:hypothetical protein